MVNIAVHEATHALQFAFGNYHYAYPGGPLWFKEGMADMYARMLLLKFPDRFEHAANYTETDMYNSWVSKRTAYRSVMHAATIENAETYGERAVLGEYLYPVLYQGGALAVLYCYHASGNDFDTFHGVLAKILTDGWSTAFSSLCAGTTDLSVFYNDFHNALDDEAHYHSIIANVSNSF
jgi:hypothetical protein